MLTELENKLKLKWYDAMFLSLLIESRVSQCVCIILGIWKEYQFSKKEIKYLFIRIRVIEPQDGASLYIIEYPPGENLQRTLKLPVSLFIV